MQIKHEGEVMAKRANKMTPKVFFFFLKHMCTVTDINEM